MEHYTASPLAVTIGFIDCINRGDMEGLAAVMARDYELVVFGTPSARGHKEGVEGWRGYATAFPRYLIHPARMATRGDTAAVLGTTTGSHLGLPDAEEMKLTLIWLGEVVDGLMVRWILIDDTPENRSEWGLG